MSANLERLLERIETKLDKQSEELQENTRATWENTVNLQEHMRRTEVLEQAHAEAQERAEERFKPLESHVAGMVGAAKAVAILGAIIGVAVGLLKIAGVLQ